MLKPADNGCEVTTSSHLQVQLLGVEWSEVFGLRASNLEQQPVLNQYTNSFNFCALSRPAI